MSVRLQLRSPVALAYSYAIPLVFLGAFWTLYRHESPPLGRHLGQLLTITALSGACFAVPAWLVSERERGVWRHYRLTPAPGGVHLVGMLGASYLLLLSAGALQIAAATVVGTPLPSNLFHLWIAFTLTSAAFLGIGLLITMPGTLCPPRRRSVKRCSCRCSSWAASPCQSRASPPGCRGSRRRCRDDMPSMPSKERSLEVDSPDSRQMLRRSRS